MELENFIIVIVLLLEDATQVNSLLKPETTHAVDDGAISNADGNVITNPYVVVIM